MRKTGTPPPPPANALATAPAGGPDPMVFVRKLSQELALGDIRLPSFPDIALRVQRVLEDPRAARTQVAQVIGADAALAARILRLANSAFLNPSGKQITDLRHALTRLGHQLTRCTAVSFAIQQMDLGSGRKELRPKLQQLWRQGTLVASIAYVLARQTCAATPDEALMTGLMHNIGRLYITQSAPPRVVNSDNEAWTRVVQEWHPRIAKSILTHWKFPPAIITAVAEQNDGGQKDRRHARLTDVLIAAMALEACVFQRDRLDDTVTAGPPFERLGLLTADCRGLLAATAGQIKALHAALTV